MNIPLIPKVLINIAGTPIPSYKYLSILQKMYDHHTFKIIISHEVMKAIGNHTLDKSKWLGKLATILMGDNPFIGIVTSVNMDYKNGHFGDLIISGFSKTILLESGSHLFSWTDRAFRDIINEVSSYAGGGLETIIEPKYSEKIKYMVQYRESNFAFLRRMACQFNEWFYYDGDKLLFGKPKKLPTYPLIYGTDIKNVQILSRLRPLQYGGFSYQSMRNEQIVGTTKDTVKGLGELGTIAFNASKELFNFYPLISSGPRIPDKKSLDDVLKNAQAAAAANLSMASGSSTLRSLRPGVVINLKYENGGTIQQYLVTSVRHNSSEKFNYLNHFEAVPVGVEVLPEPTISNPVAYPEIAKVMSNDDPDKKGRIMVQTQWQEAQDLATNWVRVMTPDAGNSDNVGTNRGFVSIPENGDQVILGYRYGDPNRPFVMGSLFHGLNGAGGDANNKIKSFTTRSGSTLTMDEDAQTATLKTSDGNSIHIDEIGGNITIRSSSQIHLVTAQKDDGSEIVMKSDGNIEVNSTKNISFSSKKIELNAEKEVKISAENVKIEGDKNHIKGESTLDGGEVYIN